MFNSSVDIVGIKVDETHISSIWLFEEDLAHVGAFMLKYFRRLFMFLVFIVLNSCRVGLLYLFASELKSPRIIISRLYVIA